MVNPWNESAISGLATVRPTGTPFPMPLAAVIMSGSTSQCSMPNHLCPVRPGGLNFVGDEVAAILLDDAECHLEIFFRRRDEASDTLNGLGKKRGDAAGGRELNHVFDVLHAGNLAFGVFQPQRAAVAVWIHRVNNADFDGPAAPRIHSSKLACK